ncbi:MFS transporter [Robbsia sp. KACC 23696]|uniref:MFS transporter n=1 Tax=Robbsia sp. KACC 23696 TaxID=3149231 RepID=UPI00325BA5E1
MRSASQPHPVFVQIAACLGFVVVLIDVSVVNVALDALRRAFRADVTDLQWVVNAYALVFASTLLMAGALGDRFGAKRILMAGYAIFTLASVGCGLAPSLSALIIWRLVQGIGASLLVPNSLSVLRQAFDDATARSRAIGWWGAGGGIALATGPVIGGLLVALCGWRSIFLLNVPVGIIGMALTARYAPTTAPQADRRLDLSGQVTAASTLAALTFALTEASRLGWESPIVIGAFFVCIAAGVTFFCLQRHNPAAMLPPALLSHKIVVGTTVIGLLINLVFYGIVFTFSLLFQLIWHLTPERTGLAFLPMMAILMMMNLVAGRLVGRIGVRALTTIALLLAAAGYLLMLPALAVQSYWLLVVPMLLASSGIALTIPTITTSMIGAVSNTQSGIASGLLNAARQIGGVIGVALFGFFVRHTEPSLFMRGVEETLLVSVALLGVGAVVAYRNLAHRESSTFLL